jgi:hypothetical protein
MGEQAHVPSGRQGSTDRAAIERMFVRLGQGHS